MPYQVLEARVGSEALIDQLRVRLGFPPEVFAHAVLPVIERYLEFVQLLPAPHAERHVFPGGLYARSMEVARRALDYRRAQILPRGAAPEVIGAQAHRWTYAVFAAALISEADRALAGLRIRTCGGAGDELWDALSGSMSECGAVSYRVEVSEDPMLGTPRTLPLSLLNRLLPPSVFEWLAADPELMQALSRFLSGEGVNDAGVIAELVLRASGAPDGSDASRGVKDQGAARQTALRQDVGTAHTVAGAHESPVNDTTAAPCAEIVTTNEVESGDTEQEYLEDFEVAKLSPGRSHAQPPNIGQGLDAANWFLDWLRASVADGTLTVNAPGSLVHFVPEGMLLVSPGIFREFAKRCSERGAMGSVQARSVAELGKSIQREFLRARWHLRAANGVNICTYHVMRHERAVSRLAGVVVPNPERFLDQVPPVNAALARLRPEESAR